MRCRLASLAAVAVIAASCGSVAATPPVSSRTSPSAIPTPTPSSRSATPQATLTPTPEASQSASPVATPAAPAADVAIASLPREAAQPAKATAAAKSIASFGLDLYGAMLADSSLELGNKNLVFSPTSIALALGMARAGARGETAAQLDRALGMSGWDQVGAGMNGLDQALVSRNATWPDMDTTGGLALDIANAAFAQRGWSIVGAYLDAIAAAFGSGLRLVDYIADPNAARKAINAWVAAQTHDRIPALLEAADVKASTRLVLVNAIYLKAEWADKFFESRTKPASFTRLDGSQVEVPTMHQQHAWPYASGNGWQATELRYLGADWSTPLAMTFIRPDDLRAFEAGLTADELARITAAVEVQTTKAGEPVDCPDMCGCHRYDVDLSLPRFSIDTRADLVPALRALGVELPFSAVSADFSGIHEPDTAEPAIYISHVIHQANIDLDEKGTEASAATAVSMDVGGCTGSSPAKVVPLRLDRPFLFILRDVETGAVLFMGRVVDPSARS